jgi:hypothetical protein
MQVTNDTLDTFIAAMSDVVDEAKNQNNQAALFYANGALKLLKEAKEYDKDYMKEHTLGLAVLSVTPIGDLGMNTDALEDLIDNLA